jgi:hypothetical protein
VSAVGRTRLVSAAMRFAPYWSRGRHFIPALLLTGEGFPAPFGRIATPLPFSRIGKSGAARRMRVWGINPLASMPNIQSRGSDNIRYGDHHVRDLKK